MKRILPFFFSLVFAIQISGQTCPIAQDGLMRIQWQNNINNFAVDYPDCKIVEGSLSISFFDLDVGGFSDVTDFSGLNQITEITGSLLIHANRDLKTIKGFEGLEKIGDMLVISHNKSLTHIQSDAFSNLKSTGQRIHIFNNDTLKSITGLANIGIRDLRTLQIENNPNLSVCNNEMVCKFLSVNGKADIEGNAPGCQNADEILNQCNIKIAKIRFGTFYDLNQDGVYQSNEPFHIDAQVAVEPTIYDIPATQDSMGTYFVAPGNYTAEFLPLDNCGI